MHIIAFNRDEIDNCYRDHFDQRGYRNIPIYTGGKHQIGYGIGAIFGNLLKSSLPILKQGLKSVGRTALKTGLNIAQDALQGKDIKAAIKTNARKAGREVINKSFQSIDGALNSQGPKKRKRTSRPLTSAKTAKRRRRVRTHKGKDIFT